MMQIKYIDRPIPPKWLIQPHYTIGRSSACDIQLDDESLLNIHAHLRFDAKLNTLILVQENNGALSVNNQPMSGQIELKNGDIVNIGSYTLMISSSTDENSKDVEGWSLYSVDPDLDEQQFTIVSPSIIGRGAKCDVHIDQGTKLSRRHAKLSIINGEFIVEDLDSSNGTFLNDKPIKKARLSHDDIVSFADIKFRVKDPFFDDEEEKTSFLDLNDLSSLKAAAAVSMPATSNRPSAIERQVQSKQKSTHNPEQPPINAAHKRVKKRARTSKTTRINNALFIIYFLIFIVGIWILVSK
jgi:pSer/pThr/pTyr-binding forkhead associated (FHA) protein